MRNANVFHQVLDVIRRRWSHSTNSEGNREVHQGTDGTECVRLDSQEPVWRHVAHI